MSASESYTYIKCWSAHCYGDPRADTRLHAISGNEPYRVDVGRIVSTVWPIAAEQTSITLSWRERYRESHGKQRNCQSPSGWKIIQLQKIVFLGWTRTNSSTAWIAWVDIYRKVLTMLLAVQDICISSSPRRMWQMCYAVIYYEKTCHFFNWN